MDEIRQALVETVVRVITAVGDQAVAIVGAVAAIALMWLKARLSKTSAPMQRQAVLSAAIDTEQWDRREVEAGREKPTSEQKRARTKKLARKTLPLHRQPLGSLNEMVEEVLPAARRASLPPE